MGLVGLFPEMTCICRRGHATGPWCLGCGRGGSGDFFQGGIPYLSIIWGLTWDDVSNGLGKSPGLAGIGVSRTMGSSLFGVEFPDVCQDVSNIAQDRSSLTSMVMLTSLCTFSRGALMGLGIRMEEE